MKKFVVNVEDEVWMNEVERNLRGRNIVDILKGILDNKYYKEIVLI